MGRYEMLTCKGHPCPSLPARLQGWMHLSELHPAPQDLQLWAGTWVFWSPLARVSADYLLQSYTDGIRYPWPAHRKKLFTDILWILAKSYHFWKTLGKKKGMEPNLSCRHTSSFIMFDSFADDQALVSINIRAESSSFFSARLSIFLHATSREGEFMISWNFSSAAFRASMLSDVLSYTCTAARHAFPRAARAGRADSIQHQEWLDRLDE